MDETIHLYDPETKQQKIEKSFWHVSVFWDCPGVILIE